MDADSLFEKKKERQGWWKCLCHLTHRVVWSVRWLMWSLLSGEIHQQISILCRGTVFLRKLYNEGSVLSFISSSTLAEYVSSFTLLSLQIISWDSLKKLNRVYFSDNKDIFVIPSNNLVLPRENKMWFPVGKTIHPMWLTTITKIYLKEMLECNSNKMRNLKPLKVPGCKHCQDLEQYTLVYDITSYL